MKTKDGNLIQTALTQYAETQKNLRTIINDYITGATQKKLQSINKMDTIPNPTGTSYNN